jgi:hypothetical protein
MNPEDTHPDSLSVYKCSNQECEEAMVASDSAVCMECGNKMDRSGDYTNYVTVDAVEEIHEHLTDAKQNNTTENGKTLYSKVKYAVTQTERALDEARSVITH